VGTDRKRIADDDAADHSLKKTKPAVGLMMRARRSGGDLASTIVPASSKNKDTFRYNQKTCSVLNRPFLRR